MPFRDNIKDREFDKFRECPEGSGETVVAVKVCDQPAVEVEASISPDLPADWDSINQYNSVSSVVNGALTDVVTYTVPATKKLVLAKVEASGSNIAKFQVDIGGSIEGLRRTYWCDFNADFMFDRLEVAAGTTIKVQVTHARPAVGDFEARIIGVEGPA